MIANIMKGGVKSKIYQPHSKMKAAVFGNVKLDWTIKFLEVYGSPVLVSMTSKPTGKHITGSKTSVIYGFCTNMETSKRCSTQDTRSSVVTSLKNHGVLWFSIHLEEITVQRQDDLLYKKLTNLNLDERFALNVALRMYTRCVVIQECVEDLQLAVESYQKKLNLLKPHSYRLDLRKMTPYTAYHDIQGIIYQDDMDRNHLMRTNELHTFSDGTLNHVRTPLNDIDTGIYMEYFPKRKWSKQEKQRARVMIKAIDKKLRDRKLMRSLEKFIGGRTYKGDLRLLQRTK
ncbi:hypothetical protein Tco_0694000 [Tanacetum coccineum]